MVVLGQHGLLLRRDRLSGLSLLATTGFDAHLNGEPPLEDIFKQELLREGLSFGEQSEYIWLPDETQYELIYESEIVKVESPLPLYLIISKAVKAPEKNRQLVTDAIVQFGEELLELLQKYETNIDYFV